MVTEGNIGDYLFTKAKGFGIDNVYQWGNIPNGAVTDKRVTIQVKSLKEDKYWFSCFAEINVCLPYMDETGTAPLIEMENVEHTARVLFDKNADSIDGQWIRYNIDSLNRLKDESLRCYYINVHLRFQVMNVNY